MENVGIFSGHWEYFKAYGYSLWSLGNFEIIWYIFHRFGALSIKIWQHCFEIRSKKERNGNGGKKSRAYLIVRLQ
jgi:hypothetical protein